MESQKGSGVAILDSVEVGRIGCYVERYHYQVSLDGDILAEALRRRQRLLASLDPGKTKGDEELRLKAKAQQWREMAEDNCSDAERRRTH